MLDWLLDFWDWVQGVFAPQEPAGYLVLRTFAQRDNAVLAEVVRYQKRAIATYRAVPQPPRGLEIWVLCDHLFNIPGDRVQKRDPLHTHRISVVQTKIGVLPEENRPESVCKPIWSGDYDLRDDLMQTNCAAVVVQAIASLLLRQPFYLLSDPDTAPEIWQTHADLCVLIELKRLNNRVRKDYGDPKQRAKEISESIRRRRRRRH